MSKLWVTLSISLLTIAFLYGLNSVSSDNVCTWVRSFSCPSQDTTFQTWTWDISVQQTEEGKLALMTEQESKLAQQQADEVAAQQVAAEKWAQVQAAAQKAAQRKTQ